MSRLSLLSLPSQADPFGQQLQGDFGPILLQVSHRHLIAWNNCTGLYVPFKAFVTFSECTKTMLKGKAISVK